MEKAEREKNVKEVERKMNEEEPDSLGKKPDSLGGEPDSLEAEPDSLEAELDLLEVEVDSLEEEVDSLEEEVDLLEEELDLSSRRRKQLDLLKGSSKGTWNEHRQRSDQSRQCGEQAVAEKSCGGYSSLSTHRSQYTRTNCPLLLRAGGVVSVEVVVEEKNSLFGENIVLLLAVGAAVQAAILQFCQMAASRIGADRLSSCPPTPLRPEAVSCAYALRS